MPCLMLAVKERRFVKGKPVFGHSGCRAGLEEAGAAGRCDPVSAVGQWDLSWPPSLWLCNNQRISLLRAFIIESQDGLDWMGP